jgi:hypothetical protein
VIGPVDDSEPARIARLMEQAREWERRTMSNVTVTDPDTGVALLEVTPLPTDPGKSDVVVRDHAGNELLKADTTAGWGLAAPQNGYPVYPALPAVSTDSGSFTEAWLYSGFMYSPTFEWAYVAGSEFTDTFAECRLEWAEGFGFPWTVIPGSTFQSNEDLSDPATVFTVFSGTATIPVTAAGQFRIIRLMLRKAAGTGLKVWCSPVYLNAL